MKLLQKILFVAMIGVFGWNVSGMIPPPPPPPPPTPPTLNLPNNTPGLQGTLQNQIINTVANIRCHHVIIPGTAAGIAFNNAGGIANVNAARAAAMVVDGNVYFPRNSVQPTTQEAVQYSCANIDNRENSPITEWYMMMFGVIPFQNAGAPGVNDYIKAGWTNPAPLGGLPVSERIIRFRQPIVLNDHAAVTNLLRTYDYDYGSNISRQEFFVKNFRKIAASSVGRVQLYRILVEIRRHFAGNDAGCAENAIYANTALKRRQRNACRSMEIRWGNFAFAASGEIYITNYVPNLMAIGKNTDNYYEIVRQPASIDIAIFHEMNHWYHWLRNTNRYFIEYNNNGHDLHFDNAIGGYAHATIGAHYWGGLGGWVGRDISESNWKAPVSVAGAMVKRVAFEEIRNILGIPSNILALNFINGDDLSENLYRMCIGRPLRFGYGNLTYYEDRRVIEKAITSCTSYKAFYNCIPRAIGNVDFTYDNADNLQGIGESKISQ